MIGKVVLEEINRSRGESAGRQSILGTSLLFFNRDQLSIDFGVNRESFDLRTNVKKFDEENAIHGWHLCMVDSSADDQRRDG